MSDIQRRIRIVVLTALDVEYQAVRNLLTNVRPVFHPAGTLFETGTPNGAGGDPVDVTLVLTGQGNQAAAVLAERANAFFRPDVMLVVGIAGTLHDDISLGDVVVATRVYDYHGGTEEGGEFRARPRVWSAPHDLEQIARHLARTRWSPVAGAHAAGERPCRIHFRPVAAGETLLNSRTSPLVHRLRQHYSDAAAIEMESAGVAHAAHLGGYVPILVLRGISDRADGQKVASDAAGWQATGAAHAAAFAIALCARIAEATGARQRHDVPRERDVHREEPRESRIVLNLNVSDNSTGFQAAGDQYIDRWGRASQ